MILLLIEMPFAFFLLTCFFSCERNTTPVTGGPDLTLSAEDVSCTEVWLKAEGIDSHKFLLERDGGEIENYSLIDGNIIYEDSLRPNTTYSYRLTRLSGAERSREVTATTLDTTSHDFNWETFTFGGEARNSILNDCAILSEDDIWCVGAIYLKDSLGNPDPSAYNAVHWDGSQWELKRIQFRYFCNQPDTFPAPANSVLAFNHNDVFISAGSQIAHWNGQHQDWWECIPVSANKLWGTDKNDIYAVGALGKIAHYNGSSWQKLESPAGTGGTDLPFQDIWGAYNKAGEEQILAVASNKFTTGGKYLVQIKGNEVIHLNDIITTAVSLSGIWFIPDRKYYLVGDGIYSKHLLTDHRWQFDPIIYQIQYYPYSITGTGINDVALCCEAGTIAHFNGLSWHIYAGEYEYDRLLSIKMKNNLVIAVGTRYNNGINDNAVIYMGRR